MSNDIDSSIVNFNNEYSYSKINDILNYNINYLVNNIYIDNYIISYINHYYKNSDKIKNIFFNIYFKFKPIKLKNIHKNYKKYDKKKFMKHTVKILKIYKKDLNAKILNENIYYLNLTYNMDTNLYDEYNSLYDYYNMIL